jgi:hypothetical protein
MHLVPKAGAVVCIWGPRALLKDILVRAFVGFSGRGRFPGGTLWLPSEIMGDLNHETAAVCKRLDPDLAVLVVRAEFDGWSLDNTVPWVNEIRKLRPNARFLFTSLRDPPIRRRNPALKGWLDFRVDDDTVPDPFAGDVLRSATRLDDEALRIVTSRLPNDDHRAADIALRALQGYDFGLLLRGRESGSYSGLLAPDGRPLDPSTSPHERVGVQFQVVNTDLFERIRARPELMRELSPRQFEEFVAGLYERHGFKVELTAASRDGGVDLYAVRYEAFGSYLTVVDCKSYAPDRPVQVKLVRELYGVVMDTGASVGVLATTSSFTKGAQALQERHRYRLALQDWFDLRDMLHQPR